MMTEPDRRDRSRRALLDRVEQDLARGDFARARERLLSRLAGSGYDAELLARAGQIAFDMHDPRGAACLWLASLATGDVVERTIDSALGPNVRKRASALSQIPRAARLPHLDDYPPPVRERLHRMGLSDVILREPAVRPRAGAPGRLVNAVIITVAVLVGLFGIVIFGLGAEALWKAVFG